MTSLSKNSVAKDRHQPRTLQLPVPGGLVETGGDWVFLLGIFDSYPLINVYIAMENGPFIDGLLVYLLKMVIFHGYVNQRVNIQSYSKLMLFLQSSQGQNIHIHKMSGKFPPLRRSEHGTMSSCSWGSHSSSLMIQQLTSFEFLERLLRAWEYNPAGAAGMF